MAQCIIIADDLTGANAAGVLFKNMNYRASTILDSEKLDKQMLVSNDCIVCCTNSRSIDNLDAYNKIFKTTQLLKNDNVLLYSKRIDSTLRGNLGSETDALLDALGNQEIAMVAPCFPTANRMLIGGHLLVNNILLHKTEIALDPKTPVTTSSAYEIFASQSKYPVKSLYINDIILGQEHLSRQIRRFKLEGVRTIIFDCISQDDLDVIAESILKSKVKFISVDPGTLTATIAKRLITPKKEEVKGKILVTLGSVNAVIKLQFDEFLIRQNVLNVFVKTKELLENEKTRDKEIRRVLDAITYNSNEFEIHAITGDGILPGKRLDLSEYTKKLGISIEEISNIINDSLAEITYQVLSNDSSFKGLYTSGGDTTLAINQKFKTIGILLLDEVVSLGVYGKLILGNFDGLKIITKGGMVGDIQAMNKCINFLRDKINSNL